MTCPNPFLWPMGSVLQFYTGRKRLLRSSKDRRLDLSDTLMLCWNKDSRTVYLGVRCKGNPELLWDEAYVSQIESQIRYDLNFDGYSVTIQRLSALDEMPRETEFLWKLRIRTQ